MQIHGQVPRRNSGASGSTYTDNVVAESSGPPACGSSETMVVSPQSSSQVEDRSMQIHGQNPCKNSGVSGSTYTDNVVTGSSGPPACGSSGKMVVSNSKGCLILS